MRGTRGATLSGLNTLYNIYLIYLKSAWRGLLLEMLKNNQKVKYIIYARKSTEDDTRQVQSIDDQIYRLEKLAKELDYKIVSKFTESKSAKDPDKRVEFYKVLKEIESGRADGILCWKLDRLSRNPVDNGRVQWMLQKGIIKVIRTIEREYFPENAGLLFSVESGMATQYVMDLSKNVIRGHDAKLRKGVFPNRPQIGYINFRNNETGESYIEKDPERYELVRKMWDLMLTGNYSANKILDIVNKNWGFKTKKTRKLGGKELSRSAIYTMFTNPFYAGIITWRGKEQPEPGKHEAMITLKEYDKVQILLGNKGKQRPKTREFPFTGFIRCGECGCQITAITKTKLIKKTNSLKDYHYYHCTRKKKDYNCSQRKQVKAEVLEEQIEREIEKLTIIPEIKTLILNKHKELNKKEIEDRTNIYETRHKTLVATQAQLDRLLDLRLSERISDEEYTEKKTLLVDEVNRLKELLRETEERAQDWLELSEKTFNFATYAHYHFMHGDIQKKRAIATALGVNFSLKDSILHIEPNDWFIPIIEDYPAIEKEYLGCELDKTDPNMLSDEQKRILENICTKLSDRRDLNPGPLPPQGSALPS